MAETPEALNAELLTRIVDLEQRIVALQAELAQHQCGHVAALLAAITTNAGNTQMDDREFREFVRRLVR